MPPRVEYFIYFYSIHVSSMFENQVFFSHLSNVERELTFRTEMVDTELIFMVFK